MRAPGIAAAAVLLTATGVLAQAPAAERAAGQEKKICRYEKMTGSLTRVRRICMTQREWAEVADNTSNSLERMERSANQAEAMFRRNNGGPVIP